MRKKVLVSLCCGVALLYWLYSLVFTSSAFSFSRVISFKADQPLSAPSTSNPESGVTKQKQVQVYVYYEALCPDSKHFLHKQLLPTSQALSNSMFVHLIPYGKAKTFAGLSGNLEFQCQHGPTECYANKIHACSKEFIKDNQDQITFATCMILDNTNPDTALTRCGKAHSVETALISECANGNYGSELLKKYGELTHKINPIFIPTIHIEQTTDNLASILKNFLLEVCKHFSDDKLPAGCI